MKKPIEIRSYGAEATYGVGRVSKRVVKMVMIRLRTREHGQIDFFLPPEDATMLAMQVQAAADAAEPPISE